MERLCAGEECFVMNFANDGTSNRGCVVLSPNFPTAKVVPVDMNSPHVNVKIDCSKRRIHGFVH
jgi:hypothetical protein